MSERRSICLETIHNIIPHHAGDHSGCRVSDCAYKVLEATRRDLSEEELKKEYAKGARFRGRRLSVNAKGQQYLMKIIASRVSEKNVDRLAKIRSSNVCENFFSCLSKFSHGKRLNLDQTDSWSVMQMFVTGLRSDGDFVDKVNAKLGIRSSVVREKERAKIERKRQLDRKRKATDEYKEVRKLKSRKKDARMAEAASKKVASSCHKTDKMHPTESCKSSATNKKRKGKCSNCGTVGCRKNTCPHPPRVADDSATTRKRVRKSAAIMSAADWSALL